MGTCFSEFHTGYRAYSRRALEAIPFELGSDDFVFDNQILVQLLAAGCRLKETPVVTRYHAEASGVGFRTSVRDGFGVVRTIWDGHQLRRGRNAAPYLRVKPLR